MVTRQNTKTSNSAHSVVVKQLGADKKKTVVAICVLVLMVFMWIRAFSKSDSDNVSASQHKEAVATESEKQLVISFVELPDVRGRNDILTRDIFTVRSWENFSGTASSGVSSLTAKGDEKRAKQIVSKLRLEAIEISDPPKVFINDRLLGIGDKLQISDAGSIFECEIMSIEKNRVFLKCMDIEIELKFIH